MMHRSTLIRLAAIAAVSLVRACNPILEGECTTEADCNDGSVCHSGLCVNPDSLPDGGDGGESKDRTPPKVVRFQPILPSRAEEHPASGAFVLGEDVVFEVEVDAEPESLTAAPVLTVPDIGDVEGEAIDTGVWRYRFPSRSLAPFGLTKRVDVTLTVVDGQDLFEPVVHEDSFRIDRRAWRWVHPAPRTITAAPAIVGELLVWGDKSGNVTAVNRETGATVWTHSLGDEVVGHVAAKGTELYVVTGNGQVVWLNASDDASQRELFRCPGDEHLAPAPPAGGVAVATTSVLRDGLPTEEALLAYVTTGGKLRLLRRSGFARPAPQTGMVCALEFPLQDATQDGITPALRTTGEAVLVHVGLASGKLVRVRVTDDGAGSLSLTHDWADATAGIAIQASSSLATDDSLAADDDAPLLLVSGSTTPDGNGQVRAFGGDGKDVWISGDDDAVSASAIETTAISANGTAWVLNRAGLLQQLRLSNGEFGPSVSLPARDPGKPRSAVVLGDDGLTYVPSGPRLSVVSESAEVLWSYDTRPTGTGTATEFVDGVTPALDCDGRLFLVVNGAQGSRVEALVTDSTGLARNGWPKGGRDNRNTFHFVSGSASTCTD